MKATVSTKYGPPDVLQLREVEKPTPKDNEVLVRVRAASVNPLDWHFLRGKPRFGRLAMGLLKPKNKILGADLAGPVEAVGKNVTQFQLGDEVFGNTFESGLGTFAEYVALPEGALALKPANISFEEAASAPLAAITALQGVRDKGKIQSEQKVLINGASGGVGTFAVQIAKSFGAEVTGVCSTRNLDMVRSIGADHVVDYTQDDFTKSDRDYDLIVDAVGNRTVSDYKRALSPEGICVIIGFVTLRRMFRHVVQGSWTSATSSKKIGLMGTVKPNPTDLAFLAKLLEDAKVVPVIDRRYPLSEVAEAIRYLEEGHAQGKVVINVPASE